MCADVLIIGGGWSGLIACKYALEEGLNPLVLEARPELGGVWNFSSDPFVTTVMSSTRTSSSRCVSELSDHPMPPEIGDFPHQADVKSYLQSYAERFGLLEHIRFESRVASTRRTSEGWHTRTCDGREFASNHLIVCVGIHGRRNPPLPQLDGFDGERMHAVSVKRIGRAIEGKRVLVVGGGETSADIVELLHTNGAADICWSIPNGQQFFRKRAALTHLRFFKSLGRSRSNRIVLDEASSRAVRAVSPPHLGKPGMAWLCSARNLAAARRRYNVAAGHARTKPVAVERERRALASRPVTLVLMPRSGTLLLMLLGAGCGRSCHCDDIDPPRPLHHLAELSMNDLRSVVGDPLAAMPIASEIHCLRHDARLQGAIDGGRVPRSGEPLPSLKDNEALLLGIIVDGNLQRYLRRGDASPIRLAEIEERTLGREVIYARHVLTSTGALAYPRGRWRDLHALYELLLAEAMPHLDGVEHLVVVPDRYTRYLPVHLLAESADPVRFVAERFSVSYASCGKLARADAVRPRGGSAFSTARGDRAALVAAKATGATAVTDAPLDVKMLQSALRSAGSLVHFSGACGAPQGGGTSEFGALRLGGDHNLHCKDVIDLDAFAACAVIAGCASGYGIEFSVYRDEDRRFYDVNMVDALLGAGVPSVVGASWAIDAGESDRQMEVFYKHLGKLGPARAMREVYLDRIKSLEPPDPRVWGAYAAHGAWR